MPEDKWDEPLEEGRFTPREIVAHLADWEPILLERMRITRDTPGGRLQGIDETQRAEEQGYSRDAGEQGELFLARRKETIAWLRTVRPEDWAKHAEHTERGRMALADQANALLGHDIYHIEQLSAYL